MIKPFQAGSALVSINRAVIATGQFGIAADGSASTTGINMTIKDTVITGTSADGIVATTSSGGAPIGVTVLNSASLNGQGFGVRSIGQGVTVRLDSTAIIGNVTGLGSANGGSLLTFGNNKVQANGANGSFTGTVPLQ